MQPASGIAASNLEPTRQRVWILPWLLLLPVLGLGSRSRVVPLPSFVVAYAGDVLWTAMAYACLIFLRPRLSILWAAAFALGFSFLIEFSQLYQAPWIDAARGHRLGALVLGRGFLASDLACYTVGALLAAGVDWLLASRRSVW
jgi:glycopeptide antibiotics resistance protein